MDRQVNQCWHGRGESMFTKDPGLAGSPCLSVPSPWPLLGSMKSSQEGECRIPWKRHTYVHHHLLIQAIPIPVTLRLLPIPGTLHLVPPLPLMPRYPEKTRQQPPQHQSKGTSWTPWLTLQIRGSVPQLVPLCWPLGLTVLGLCSSLAPCPTACTWLTSGEVPHAQVSTCPGQGGMKGLAVSSLWLTSCRCTKTSRF